MGEPLECGNVSEKTEQYHQPAKPREPVERSRIYQADNSNHHNQDEPISPAEHPAIKSSDANGLGLRSKVGCHQDTGQGKNANRPRNQSAGKETADDKNISVPVYCMIKEIPSETLDFHLTGNRTIHHITKRIHRNSYYPPEFQPEIKKDSCGS
jgi:hypothetical protein